MAAGAYAFLVAPRMIKKPDVSVLKGVHYAHRGLHDNHSDAPENSMKAFQKAVDAGYGIEMDIQLTKDKIPVVFHDETLNRMCGVEGKVWEFTYEELQKLTLAESEERIPKFEDVLALVGGKVPLIVEYKLDVPSTEVC
ncbi:MAG: glycerophosphodiester phosphodiesterase, partial [Lachnospiraceae bacterium]|nr:glycerophosphodiester phosphodiesterase [Lachnospiraceae bacterium]